MSQWSRKCGCTGGDGGCSYGSAWVNKCDDYPHCVNGVEDARRVIAGAAQYKVKKEARSKAREPLMLVCTKHPTYRAVLPSRAACDVCREIYDLVHTLSNTQIRVALLGAVIQQKREDAIIDQRFK